MTIPVLLPLIVFLTGCATVNRSTQYRLQNVPSPEKEGIAVAAFRAGHDLAARPSDARQTVLGVFTLGISSFIFPPQSRFAAFCPNLPSHSLSRIRSPLDAELVNYFNVFLGDPIDWTHEIKDGNTSIKELATVARSHGKKYLYLILYNEYNVVAKTISSEPTSLHYKRLRGSIPMASSADSELPILRIEGG